MADDTLLGLRSASAAAEDYLNIEYGARAGRNAAILKDAASDISDTAEMRLISLAHAFVFEYFEDANPDRSLQGCLQSFLNLTMETLKGLFDYDEWNGAVDSYMQACEDIFDGYSKDKNFDPRILAVPSDADPLLDDDMADDDPEGCVEGHLRYVPDSELQHLYKTVQSVIGKYGKGDVDSAHPNTEGALALLRSIRLADEELSEGDDPEEEEARIDLRPAVPKKGPVSEKDGGSIPRFTASNGSVKVEFVFGGDPYEDPLDRSRARRPEASGWLGLPRQEPQVHQGHVHRGLPQQQDEPHQHHRHEPALRGEDHGEPPHVLLEQDGGRGVRDLPSGKVHAPQRQDRRPRAQRVRQEEERQRPPRLPAGVQEALRPPPTP